MSSSEPSETRLIRIEAALARAEQERAVLEQQMRKWSAVASDPAGAIETHVALLEDANGWAQHFSTVRLTLTTFLVSIALGVMQVRWEDATTLLRYEVLGIWMLAAVLLVYFTVFEYRKLRHGREAKNVLFALTGKSRAAKDRRWYSDVPLWCFVALSIGFYMAWDDWQPQSRASVVPAAQTEAAGR